MQLMSSVSHAGTSMFWTKITRIEHLMIILQMLTIVGVISESICQKLSNALSSSKYINNGSHEYLKSRDCTHGDK